MTFGQHQHARNAPTKKFYPKAHIILVCILQLPLCAQLHHVNLKDLYGNPHFQLHLVGIQRVELHGTPLRGHPAGGVSGESFGRKRGWTRLHIFQRSAVLGTSTARSSGTFRSDFPI